MFHLRDYQLDAIRHLNNGNILVGGVGSGKSITSLAYYYYRQMGWVERIRTGWNPPNEYKRMPNPKDLIIITTAKKRDSREWESELIPFMMSTNKNNNGYKNKVVVDSWNNIKKYITIRNAFFIFDEQRVVGKGAWVKAFLKICKQNEWILLSATPGDTWEDYGAVFVANGFFNSLTQYRQEHFEYDPWSKFPRIKGYHGTNKLVRLRERLLVPMDFHRETVSHHIDIPCGFDMVRYKRLTKSRWNDEKDQPIQNSAELCGMMRKIVNTDLSRQISVLDILKKHRKAIIFYNYDYELDILRKLCEENDIVYAEWNGHFHQEIPETDDWIFLCQYNAGAEGWNCIKTDCIIFYSANYSYKIMTQAAGRIDRMNTPYKDLYYYHLKSKASIDLAVERAIREKKKFNEGGFVKRMDIRQAA